jgi:hypothetical protein
VSHEASILLSSLTSPDPIFWLKDESLEDSANLPDPDIIAAEIVEDLQAALAQFAEIPSDLKRSHDQSDAFSLSP